MTDSGAREDRAGGGLVSAGRGRVVVGVDDVPLGDRETELIFAAEEANRRGVDLLLVHGCAPLSTATAPIPTTSAEHRRRRGSELLEAAADWLRPHLQPRRAVHVAVDAGTGVQALVSASSGASLLVLQRRSVPAYRRWHTGSTTSRVCAQAWCPVAVVRAAGPAVDRGGVVAAIDTRGHAAHVLDVAFAEAALRDQPLIAVHAWLPPGPTQSYGFVPPDPDEVRIEREVAIVELSEVLAGHRAGYPDVEVQQRVVAADVRAAVDDAAGTAQLVVVGRHARHGAGSLGLGGLARHCLAEASCPVIVAPSSRAPRQRHWIIAAEVPIQPL
jgi:nucleotide-binding universal stress UspA family protein